MKDLSLLVWLTQLGLSVGIPLAVFIGGGGRGSITAAAGEVGLCGLDWLSDCALLSADFASPCKPWNGCPKIARKKDPAPVSFA